MASPALHIEQIALYLGRPWKVNRLREPSSWSHEIIDGTGRGLHFRVDGERFIISGLFPRNKTSHINGAYRSIGVSIKRPAKAIAADIMRRLLPCYVEFYAKAVKHYSQEQEKQTRLSHIATLLARRTGGRVADNSCAARTVYFTHGTAELWSDETITLALSRVSVEQAIQIAEVLKL